VVDRPSAATGSPFTVATSRTSAAQLALPAAHAQAVTVDDRAPALANDPEMGRGVGGHLALQSMMMDCGCPFFCEYGEKSVALLRFFLLCISRFTVAFIFPQKDSLKRIRGAVRLWK
jgi:hypothetical protein